MSPGRASIPVLVVVLVAACVGNDPDNVGATPGPDSGTTSSSGGPSGPSVASFDFKDGCLDWESSSADRTDDTIARSAPKSCRVCNRQSEPGYDLNRRIGVPLEVGAEYLLSAWVRGIDGTEVATIMAVGMRTEDNALSTLDEGRGDAPTALRTDDWIEIRATIKVEKPNATGLRIAIGSQDQNASCFLVDDVTVSRR